MGAYSIGEMPPPLQETLFARLNQVETATVGHLRHFGFMNPAIRPVNAERRVVGAAITLALPAHDSTLLHYALGLTRPGDVIVIDRLGDDKYACWGGGVTNAAQKAHVAGAIVAPDAGRLFSDYIVDRAAALVDHLRTIGQTVRDDQKPENRQD
jgi:hypothetical protein